MPLGLGGQGLQQPGHADEARPRSPATSTPRYNASLDELLVKIKADLTKLGPILDLEMCGSQRGRTAVERSSTADAQGLEPRHRVSG
ncbi:MAG TPA: hypothetical protein VNZ53_12510 [Steroidobacteraceae bacterium]|nr:hypothetical protein [Steroidobacteraceae bacterium]